MRILLRQHDYYIATDSRQGPGVMADVSVTETGLLETDGRPRLGSLHAWVAERITGLKDTPVYNWLSTSRKLSEIESIAL